MNLKPIPPNEAVELEGILAELSTESDEWQVYEKRETFVTRLVGLIANGYDAAKYWSRFQEFRRRWQHKAREAYAAGLLLVAALSPLQPERSNCQVYINQNKELVQVTYEIIEIKGRKIPIQTNQKVIKPSATSEDLVAYKCKYDKKR